jgi:hypothetical protein
MCHVPSTSECAHHDNNYLIKQRIHYHHSHTSSSTIFSTATMPPSFAASVFSLLSILGLVAGMIDETEKCYSCASADFHTKWPKGENNQLLYLEHFPYYVNRTCDSVHGLLPVIPCPESVCVKVILQESASNRAVCNHGPVIVRDCWSRIIRSENNSGFTMRPPTSRRAVQLVHLQDATTNTTVGEILSCEGYLCNHSQRHTAASVQLLLTALSFHFLQRQQIVVGGAKP